VDHVDQASLTWVCRDNSSFAEACLSQRGGDL